MRTAASVALAYQPRKPEDLHIGYGVQLDPATITNHREAYCSDPAAWTAEVLTSLRGKAPVECVLWALEREGYWYPEEVLFDAITDSAGGFSFYPLH